MEECCILGARPGRWAAHGAQVLDPEARLTLGPADTASPPSWGRLLSQGGGLGGSRTCCTAPATSTLCPWAASLPSWGLGWPRTAPEVQDRISRFPRLARKRNHASWGGPAPRTPGNAPRTQGRRQLSRASVLPGRLAVFGEPRAAPRNMGSAGTLGLVLLLPNSILMS